MQVVVGPDKLILKSLQKPKKRKTKNQKRQQKPKSTKQNPLIGSCDLHCTG